MADIATLGLVVDASGMVRGVQQANAELGKLEQASQRSFAEIKRDVSQATADFNKGKISVTDYKTALEFARKEATALKQSVAPTGTELQAFNGVMRATGDGAVKGTAGLNTLRSAMGSLAFTTAGLPGRLGEVSSMLGSMAFGSLTTAGVFAGIAALSMAYRNLAEDSNRLKEETRKAREELEKLARTQAQGLTGERRGQVESQRLRQREIEAEQAKILSESMLGQYDARIVRLQQEYDKLQKLIETGETEINQTLREELAAEEDMMNRMTKRFNDERVRRIEEGREAAEDAARKAAAAIAAAWSAGSSQNASARRVAGQRQDNASATIASWMDIDPQALARWKDAQKNIRDGLITLHNLTPQVSTSFDVYADAIDEAAEGSDNFAMTLATISSQIGGMASSIGQLATQFLLVAEAAEQAATASGKALSFGDYMKAGAAGAAPGAMAMVGNWVAGQIGQMLQGRDATELRKLYEANTAALEKVSKNMEDYASRIAGMNPGQVGDFREVLAWLRSGGGSGISSAQLKETGAFFGFDTSAKMASWAQGLTDALIEALAKAKEQIQAQFVPDFAARAATLAGNNEEAARIRREAAAAKEIVDLQKLADAGFITAEQMAEFARIINEELAVAARDAADAIKTEAAEAFRAAEEAARAAAEATRQYRDDLAVRGLRLTGRNDMADTLALGIRQRREREQYAGQSPEMLRLLDFVHGMERKELEFNQAVGAIENGLRDQLNALEAQRDAATDAWQKQDAAYADQIELAEAALRVTEEAYNEQIKAAQEQLRVAEDQLREQERTVDALRDVVANLADFRQSLLTSNLTQLSPAQQLEVARDEFTRLAGLAMGGNAAAGNALPGAARAFLEASRGYNASGMRYQADWDAVNNVLFTVQGRFQAQLSVEERMLAALQTQVGQLEQQIDQIGAARDQAVADAQRQIAELQAAREQARNEYESQIAAIEEQMRLAQAAADAQVAALREEFAGAQRLWQAQLEELIRQTGILATVGTYITDQGGGGIPPDIKPDLDLIVANTAAGVNVQQAGFSAMANELAGVRAEVAGLRADTRRALEPNF